MAHKECRQPQALPPESTQGGEISEHKAAAPQVRSNPPSGLPEVGELPILSQAAPMGSYWDILYAVLFHSRQSM